MNRVSIMVMIVMISSHFLHAMEKMSTVEASKDQRMAAEKQQLFDRIFQVTAAQENIVQKSIDQLLVFARTLPENGPLHKELNLLKERIIQPELLIRAELALRNNLLITQQIPAGSWSIGTA